MTKSVKSAGGGGGLLARSWKRSISERGFSRAFVATVAASGRRLSVEGEGVCSSNRKLGPLRGLLRSPEVYPERVVRRGASKEVSPFNTRMALASLPRGAHGQCLGSDGSEL